MKLVTSAQMRDLESLAVSAGVSLDMLMANAGLAVAQEVWMQLGDLEARQIVVLVGPGNNGGDGLVAARQLAEWGSDVHCYALAPRDDSQWQATQAAEIPCATAPEDDGFQTLDRLLDGAEMVVDALLGTGSARPITGNLAEILTRLRAARMRSRRPKLIAVDLPTGLDADRGQLDPLTVTVDETVTFQYAKVGLYTRQGAAAAGDVQVVDIGIPHDGAADLPYALLDRREAKALLPARPPDANKGTFGRVLVVAGSAAYPGASILASLAAYRVGAGLVTLATPAPIVNTVVAAMPETTYLPLPDNAAPGAIDEGALSLLREALPGYDVLVLGCGLGRHPSTAALVRRLLQDDAARDLKGLILDADGLNAVAASAWPSQLAAPTVVTPHPGEMARLLATETAAVQDARLDIALQHARTWGVTVVLKGANTVIAAAAGAARISPVAHNGIATAGTGDILAGAIGGLLAQGLPPFQAACLAVYLHADAGTRAAKAQGSAGMTATDLLQHLPLAGRALAGEEPPVSGGLGLPGIAALGTLTAQSGSGPAGAADSGREGGGPDRQ